MSRFARAMARANRVMATALADGLATYRRANGETIESVSYTLERDALVYDDPASGIGRITTIVEIPVSAVPDSGQGDVIETPEGRWYYVHIVTDDGDFRRIEVN
ncbi:hypothetical protein [Salinicola endophyticus]|uniref:Uncharacterized protein n=1 Tax=Salinicola endophyticus TaxID=1949083 RepID=A0AB74UAF0_9GAMM